MEQLPSVIKTIKSEMERQELSVQALAEKAGVSFVNLYAIFNGETSPTIATTEKLMRALNMRLLAGLK